MFSRLEITFILLASAGLVTVGPLLATHFFGNTPKRALIQTLTAVSVLIAALSVVHYAADLSKPTRGMVGRFHHYMVGRIDPYDLTFYYLNTKYFPEIGYFDLYPLLLTYAYGHNRAPFPFRADKALLQNENEFYWRGFKDIIEDRAQYERIQQRFSPERWSAFEHDVSFLLAPNQGWTSRRWTNFFWDHGFNAAPVWLLLYHPLTNLVPIEWVKLLCLFDLLVLLLGIVCIGIRFGTSAAMLLITVLTGSFSTEWPPIGLVLGRYDYVGLLLLTAYFVRGGGALMGGGLLGLSGLFRYLPLGSLLLWAFQSFCAPDRACSQEDHERARQHRRLLTASGLTIFILSAFLLVTSPTSIKREFFSKMRSHTSHEFLTRGKIGLGLALSWDGDLTQRRIEGPRIETIKRQRLLHLVTATILTGSLVMAVMGKGALVSLLFSPFLFFFWFMPSYHYQVLFLLPLLGLFVVTTCSPLWWVSVGVLATEVFVRFLRVTLEDAPVSVTSLWAISLSLISLGFVWEVVRGWGKSDEESPFKRKQDDASR